MKKSMNNYVFLIAKSKDKMNYYSGYIYPKEIETDEVVVQWLCIFTDITPSFERFEFSAKRELNSLIDNLVEQFSIQVNGGTDRGARMLHIPEKTLLPVRIMCFVGCF